MQASKESANEAMESLKAMTNMLPRERMTTAAKHVVTLEEFIKAAAKRLPSQIAIDRDRCRKRAAKVK